MSNDSTTGSNNNTHYITDKALAQSAALAVQDAANTMRDMNTLVSTASGVVLANFIESGDLGYLQSLETLHKQASSSTQQFIHLYSSVTEQKNG